MLNKWISCEDELPEIGVYVLVTDGRRVDVGYYDEDGLWDNDYSFFDPDDTSHWMSFPEDPRDIGEF